MVPAASLLAANTPSEQLPSDALHQTWHRLRLAVHYHHHHLPHTTATGETARVEDSQGHDWTKCNDNIKQISGICSSWLKGKDPSMTLPAFQWCHNNMLASVTSPSGDVEDRLDLQLHLSATCPVLLC